MKKSAYAAVFFFFSGLLYPQTDIKGRVEWDRMELSALVSLNLKEAGLKLPAGRTQAEALLEDNYPALLGAAVMKIQVDSNSTVEDFVASGKLSLRDADGFPFMAGRVPPFLSPDLSRISARYFLSLHTVSSVFIKHHEPQEPAAPLRPSAAKTYTGIIIIADESLPVHGRNTAASLKPCLFPKIWDSEMTLIYEKNMTYPGKEMVLYVSRENIFARSPSGLDEGLAAKVGNNPLKIMARGVFGRIPTDPVIDREDALVILSSDLNRRLLKEGKVALVVDRNTLRNDL